MAIVDEELQTLQDEGTGFAIEALEDTVAFLRSNEQRWNRGADTYAQVDVVLTPIGKAWRERAAHHLCKRLDRALREGPIFDSEQAVMAILKDTAQELRAAGTALVKAAEEIRETARPMAAQRAYLAGKKALAAAEGLVSA